MSEPNTFDLGIALAAGAIATYAKVNPGAVSSMAGTAIAVALNGCWPTPSSVSGEQASEEQPMAALVGHWFDVIAVET